MRKVTFPAGLAALACLACCLPLLAPLMAAGAAALGLGGFYAWAACQPWSKPMGLGLGLVALGGLGLMLWRRKRRFDEGATCVLPDRKTWAPGGVSAPPGSSA